MSDDSDDKDLSARRWYLKHVFVPLIGQGGAIAIIVALLARSPEPVVVERIITATPVPATATLVVASEATPTQTFPHVEILPVPLNPLIHKRSLLERLADVFAIPDGALLIEAISVVVVGFLVAGFEHVIMNIRRGPPVNEE